MVIYGLLGNTQGKIRNNMVHDCLQMYIELVSPVLPERAFLFALPSFATMDTCTWMLNQ